jgi:hypothetical protein
MTVMERSQDPAHAALERMLRWSLKRDKAEAETESVWMERVLSHNAEFLRIWVYWPTFRADDKPVIGICHDRDDHYCAW